MRFPIFAKSMGFTPMGNHQWHQKQQCRPDSADREYGGGKDISAFIAEAVCDIDQIER